MIFRCIFYFDQLIYWTVWFPVYFRPTICVGGYSGVLQLWDYEKKWVHVSNFWVTLNFCQNKSKLEQMIDDKTIPRTFRTIFLLLFRELIISRSFGTKALIQCVSYNTNGNLIGKLWVSLLLTCYLCHIKSRKHINPIWKYRSWLKSIFFPICFNQAIGFIDGSVRILDSLSLQEEGEEESLAIFKHCHDSITHLMFSHNSKYLASAVSLFMHRWICYRFLGLWWKRIFDH